LAATRCAAYNFAMTTVGGANRADTDALEIRRFVVYPERGVAGLAVVARHAFAAVRSIRTRRDSS
jgi:hypothetical protein